MAKGHTERIGMRLNHNKFIENECTTSVCREKRDSVNLQESVILFISQV